MARRSRKDASAVSSAISSAMSSKYPSAEPSRASSPRRQPFRFFDLPAELRLRIYEQILDVQEPIDLHPMNGRIIFPRLALFLVNHRMHEEAYRIFYAQTIRLFPSYGPLFNTKKPLLERLPVRYREAINTMELRLGPGWSKPPRCQHTKPNLGLLDCTSMRTLKIFIEIDPSENMFAGFRGVNATEDTYKWFCVDLLDGIMRQVPSLETIEIDANPGVKKGSPLVAALKRKIEEFHKRLVWGPLRGFGQEDSQEPGLIGLESAMASLGIPNESSKTVQVSA